MLGGLLFALLIVVLIINFQFYSAQASTLQLISVFFIAFLIIVMISMFNFFSIMVHLHMSTLQLVKNAILITIGRPLATIMMTVTNLFILYISFFHMTFLIPFFMGSLIAYMSFFHFYRVFNKIQEKQEEYESEIHDSERKDVKKSPESQGEESRS